MKKELSEAITQLIQWRQTLSHKLSQQLQQTQDLFNNAESASIGELENFVEREEIIQSRTGEVSFDQYPKKKTYWNGFGYWNGFEYSYCFGYWNSFTSAIGFIRPSLPSVHTSNTQYTELA